MTPNEIITLVCDHYGASEEDVISGNRKRIYSLPRHVSAYFIWRYFNKQKRKEKGYFDGLILHQIGELLGNKDHSSAIHGKNVVMNLCDTDKEFRNTIELINEQIRERMERE
jgi:chromosomal replication initiator protein